MKFRNRSGQHSMWVIYHIPEWVKHFFCMKKIDLQNMTLVIIFTALSIAVGQAHGRQLGPGTTTGHGKNTPIAIWKKGNIGTFQLWNILSEPVLSVAPNVYNFVKILRILTKDLWWKYVATHGSFALCQIHTNNILVKYMRRSIKWALNHFKTRVFKCL